MTYNNEIFFLARPEIARNEGASFCNTCVNEHASHRNNTPKGSTFEGTVGEQVDSISHLTQFA
jgi:hypothetical protein